MITRETVAEFAATHVAPLEGLEERTDFPQDLWERMGDAGLLGLHLPKPWGAGADSAAMIEAGEAFVRAGGNLGMAAGWFGHCLVARFFILGFGGAEHQAAYLPALGQGRLTASVAISEPGAGAHPKYLACEAVHENGAFRLSGEKFYVTNGNMARLFVVVAITENRGGRKRFSAFLLPRDTPGLTVHLMPPLDYLRPSQHVRLELADCRLPADAMLGGEGTAFEAMARPFRDVEDIMNAGPKLGGMAFQVNALLARMRSGKAGTPPEARGALGGLGARLSALRALAGNGARMLDEVPGSPELEKLALAFRLYCGEFQQALACTRALCGIAEQPRLDAMTRELTSLGGLAGKAAAAKQAKLAATMLAERNRGALKHPSQNET